MNCSKQLPYAVILVLLTSLACATQAAGSASKTNPEQCREVAEYVVRDLSFAKTSTEAAFRTLLEGTPLQLRYLDKAPQRQIGAEHVTGDLSIVLKDFAAEAGITWFQSSCSVVVPDSLMGVDSKISTEPITSAPAPKNTKNTTAEIAASTTTVPVGEASTIVTAAPQSGEWVIRKGQRFSDALTQWCHRASCPGVFWETIELESGIQQTFSGTYLEAVNTAVETLAKQGLPIRAVYYSGNDVFRILGKK